MKSVIAEPTRRAGLQTLNAFLENAGTRYAKLRNFDFGPKRRDNVSRLSPYLRHRLVLEQEVLEAVLSRHEVSAAQKFVEEVFWRGYFKGWLEHRPRVWTDYRDDVSRLVQDLASGGDLRTRYSRAVTGKTGIDCFDAWAAELISTGYLHNHARMWFASIWIYTLKLPWQLGADFFYRHLIDADPASNTLSWRWVCGLHTQGKTYLARASNVARYTGNRFNPVGQLATSAPPLTEPHVYPPAPLPGEQMMPRGGRFGLLITEEDGCPASLLDGQVPESVLGIIAENIRSPLKTGSRAADFVSATVADSVQRTAGSLGIAGEVCARDEWSDLLVDWAQRHRVNVVVTAYAPVGPVAELLAKAAAKLEHLNIELVQVRRQYDGAVWQHSRQGYYKLRNRIPRILGELAVTRGSATCEH